MNINNALKGMLNESGMTAAKLSRKLGVTPQSVNNYLNGMKDPKTGEHRICSVKVDTAVDIAEALGYEMAFIPPNSAPDKSFVVDERISGKRNEG